MTLGRFDQQDISLAQGIAVIIDGILDIAGYQEVKFVIIVGMLVEFPHGVIEIIIDVKRLSLHLRFWIETAGCNFSLHFHHSLYCGSFS